MTSDRYDDRHDDRHRDSGAEGPDGQGGQTGPKPGSGRDTQLREELRARMRAIEAGFGVPKPALAPDLEPVASGPDRSSTPDEALETDESPAGVPGRDVGRRSGFSAGGFGFKRS